MAALYNVRKMTEKGALALVIVIICVAALMHADPQRCKWLYIIHAMAKSGDGTLDPPSDFTGAWADWYPNGRRRALRHFVKGVAHGRWKYWYENGCLSAEYSFRHGKSDSAARKWDDNGQLRSVDRYREGVPNGLWQSWGSDGTCLTRVYRNGKLDGSWSLTDDAGTVIQSGTYRNGALVEGLPLFNLE